MITDLALFLHTGMVQVVSIAIVGIHGKVGLGIVGMHATGVQGSPVVGGKLRILIKALQGVGIAFLHPRIGKFKESRGVKFPDLHKVLVK